MICSIKGTVIEVGSRTLVIENQGLGYEIIVSNPKAYHINQDVFLYLYRYKHEDIEYFVGLSSKDERSAFRLLINVNGVGPKTALAILSKLSYGELLTAISNNDFELISALPGISPHMANQIFLDLREHISRNVKSNTKQYKDVKEGLKKLGYKAREIDKVLPNIYISNGTTELVIKEALRRLQNGKAFG